MGPNPTVTSVNINSATISKLNPQQLGALDVGTLGKKDAISQAIHEAVAAEEKRRAEEERKKEKQREKDKQKEKDKAAAEGG
jgi:hypothetical protein